MIAHSDIYHYVLIMDDGGRIWHRGQHMCAIYIQLRLISTSTIITIVATASPSAALHGRGRGSLIVPFKD